MDKYMTKGLGSVYYNNIVTRSLFELASGSVSSGYDNTDFWHKCVSSLCDFIENFREICDGELLIRSMAEKLKTNCERLMNEGREEEVGKLKLDTEKDIEKLKSYFKSIKILTENDKISCNVYNNNGIKELRINFRCLDLCETTMEFLKLVTVKIKEKYKEDYENIVINFDNCLIGQTIFNVLKNREYNKNEIGSKIIKGEIEINGIGINYSNLYLKDVNLMQYSFNELVDKDKTSVLNDYYFYFGLLKNVLNYKTLMEVINFIKENNKEREILSLNLTGLSIEELEEFYEKNEDAAYFRVVDGFGYNGIKLSVRHVEKILNLKTRETYLGRTRGDLHGFDLSRSDLYCLCLDGANLNDTNLAEANFYGSSLENIISNDGTNFHNACLTSARISRKQIENILNLKEYETYLGRTAGDLSEFDLSEPGLMNGINFNGLNLSNSILEDCLDLTKIQYDKNTNFNGTRMLKARISRSEVEKILNQSGCLGRKKGDLSEFDLSKLDLSCLNFSGVNLLRTNLSYSNLSNIKIDIEPIFASYSYQLRAKISRKEVEKILNLKNNENYLGRKKGDLRGFDLSNLDLNRLDFSGANLMLSNLSRTNLFKAVLNKTKLVQTNLSETNLSEAVIDEKTNFMNAIINGAMITEEQINNNSSLKLLKEHAEHKNILHILQKVTSEVDKNNANLGFEC